jgi:hypothetical protein
VKLITRSETGGAEVEVSEHRLTSASIELQTFNNETSHYSSSLSSQYTACHRYQHRLSRTHSKATITIAFAAHAIEADLRKT